MAVWGERPYLPIAAFTTFCGLLILIVIHLLDMPWDNSHLFSLVFFAGLTLLIHLWQERHFKTDPKGFVRRFMLGLILKMFISLFAVVAMLLLLKSENRILTVLVFGFLYLAFLGFSTVRLVNLSKRG